MSMRLCTVRFSVHDQACRIGPAPAAGREQSRQARTRPGETIVKLAKRTAGLRPVANRLAGASDCPTAGSADRARPSRLARCPKGAPFGGTYADRAI